ncbi:MAG: Gfo/Idh/MocA family oxidoreductase [Caldilineaceae bacterium SB0662_bin_9]|uniref:Gfo/Idh/MocA family oxidoreductase n=1 Tax=Caldilineaceae bacterium SB0662_bin_9 TaxID=2605258 RepID=A0A6B1DWU0_9CHLR|nr:Gfo/Idh/MocA family oxidoreductase [Caldilineaceae bacterium SB0662_bin_9]
MSTTLKVGVVGVGGIARTHMPGWAASEDAEVVAGSDVVEPALKEWGAMHGISRLYTDVKDLFADPDIDIIDVCTPNMYHRDLSIGGLEAGKHVICEKPLAPTPDDIRAMMTARDKAGKLLMTAQHFRFSGLSQAMKTEIETGTLGNIYHGRSWMLRRNGFIPSPSFVEKKHSGGGPCIDIGVHVLDLTLWLMGNPEPVAITGVSGAPLAHLPGQFAAWRPSAPMPGIWDVEDYAVAFVRFDTGATLVLETSWLLHHDIDGEDMQIWLYGDKGGCHYPEGKFLSTNYETKQMYTRTLKITRDQLEPHAQEVVEFARAIKNGAPSPVPSEHSLQVLTILDGIYRSQAAGKEISLV